MLSTEKKIIDWCKNHRYPLYFIAMSAIAVFMRLTLLDAKSIDYKVWLEPWYEHITANGRLSAITEQVGDYNVLYQLLIALLSYLPIHPLTLYKGLSSLFDYFLALCSAKLVYDLCGEKIKAILAFTLILICPSVLINSGYWAQCDSIYCFFLLASLLCIIKRKVTLAFVLYAFAFQFKLQAIFFLPFLLYYYISTTHVSFLHFGIIPGISVIICMLCGRHPFETFYIYAAQTNTWPGMSLNFPSIWNLITKENYFFTSTAILITIAFLGIGLFLILEYKPPFNAQNIITISIWSVWTCLLFLPSLHDRYAYFLNVMLLLSAVLNHRLIGYAVTCEILTLVSYARFLWQMSDSLPSDHLCSSVFVFLYILFIYQNFILKSNWIPSSSSSAP